MTYQIKPINLNKVRTYSLKQRKNKVEISDFSKIYQPGSSFKEFLKTLPNILGGKDFKEIVALTLKSFLDKKPIIFCMGAHVIKCGISPLIIELMDKGVISLIALNGAGSIHDVELAMIGQTSEDVGEGIKEGNFGMVKETAQFINLAAKAALKRKKGLGEVLGEKLVKSNFPYKNLSILNKAFLKNIPVTVHLAIGGDINHMHPSACGEAFGWGTFYDFRLFTSMVAKLIDGGIIFNFGSAVILPVVIEKALNIAKNLGYNIGGFTGVNFDFIKPYRSNLNPVERAKILGGKGYNLIGQHEILIPLLISAILEEIRNE